MSPNYAGTIVGVANTIASSAGFASPIVTGYLTDGQVKKKFQSEERALRFSDRTKIGMIEKRADDCLHCYWTAEKGHSTE